MQVTLGALAEAKRNVNHAWCTCKSHTRSPHKQLHSSRRTLIDGKTSGASQQVLHEVTEKEAFTDRATQMSCATDTASLTFLTFRTKPEKNTFVKTKRHSQYLAAGGGRPVKYHEELSWEEMCVQKTSRVCKISHTYCDMATSLPQISIGIKTRS